MANLTELDIIGRLLIAALLGGVLGIEREHDGQDAGLRTHMLVVLGAALFGVTSIGAFDEFVTTRSNSNVTVDVTRIASYVAPGVGFIGGGAILKYGGRVSGITTAASLWGAAAIGVAVGVGFWVAAVTATVVTLMALGLLQPLSRAANRRGRRNRSAVSLDVSDPDCLPDVMQAVREAAGDEIQTLHYGVGPDSGGHISVEFWATPTVAELDRIVTRLAGVRGVTAVKQA